MSGTRQFIVEESVMQAVLQNLYPQPYGAVYEIADALRSAKLHEPGPRPVQVTRKPEDATEEESQ